ncbi:hypothetical protein [Bradyrhizobium sp. 62]|uniref:hypothetical protein n=1 Tax=Bradyrhizobium sp. 62 TaxID=1043588 RepID=UPI001FFBE76E|nr:hypothetical protein [Bradyrhizobium sp. 62]MCK1367801.1 hypothetical protein [Bradyrhizobium sp. 62]
MGAKTVSTAIEDMKKTWPIGERVELKLMMIAQICEYSTSANSLPHVARIAKEAVNIIRAHRAGDESTASSSSSQPVSPNLPA